MRASVLSLLPPFLLALAVPASAGQLRIATFNVKWLTASASESRLAPWKTEAQLDAHRAALARILAESVRADVVCLLEVTSRKALEKLLAEPMLQSLRYAILHVESEDTGTGQDVAFLVAPHVRLDPSDGGILRRFADTLPGRPAGLRRGDPRRARLTKHALLCLAAPERVCLLGLHLLAHPDDPGRTARRAVQARIAAHLIRTKITGRDFVPVVLGDLNDFDPDVAGPSGYKVKTREVLAILKDFDPARSGDELYNAAEKIRPPENRWSVYWDKNRNARMDAGEPVSLLDHILVDKSLRKRIRKAEILHTAHDGSVSDHWPVVIELR